MSPRSDPRKPRSSTRLRPLEYRVFRRVGERLRGQRVLLACSGGIDSVALVHVLARLSVRTGCDLVLAHIHHGNSSRRSIRAARDQALARVEKLGNELNLPVLTRGHGDFGRNGSELKSEEQLRDFRHQALEALRVESNADFIALAHHADDLFETRLIRLIRGTGPQGLPAMREFDARLWRPFLTETKTEIEAYARETRFEWVQDPTNAETNALRNWIRNTWLVALDRKRPGSSKAFRLSLERVAEACAMRTTQESSAPGAFVDRKRFQRLGKTERRSVLAAYLRALGVRNFGATHIGEICKRLDTPRKVFTFEVLQLHWSVNAEQIVACHAP